MKKLLSLICILISVLMIFCSCGPAAAPDTDKKTESTESTLSSEITESTENNESNESNTKPDDTSSPTDNIPPFSDSPYVVLNDNQPDFSQKDKQSGPFERYSELDSLGRCGVALACLSPSLMPTEERGSIGQVKPSGWVTVKYDIVDGKYLYNRCHLIGFQLTGENANELNLITGTRYMNVNGMLPFENMVADYIKETGNHVLYRVTPIFKGSELVARGVQLEALSVEDDGEGICFNVYVYNNQPGISINYLTGESALGNTAPECESDSDQTQTTYILNKNSKKFHLADCSGAKSIAEHNKEVYTGDRDSLIAKGYDPCGICKP